MSSAPVSSASRPPGKIAGILRVAPEAFFVVSGQVVGAAGNIFAIRILTTLLPPAGYGQLALALTGAVLAQQLVFGPIGTACIRYFAPAQESGELGTYTRAIAKMFLAGTLALGVIALAVGFFLLETARLNLLPSLVAAAGFAWLSSADSMIDGIQNAARQRKIVALHQGIGAWLRLGIVVAVARYLTQNANSILWSYSAGYALLILSQLYFLSRTLGQAMRRTEVVGPESGRTNAPHATGPMLRSMWTYTWPFSAWGVFSWIQASSDRWALGAFAGLDQVGLYQSVYQVGYYPISMLTQFLLQVSTPIIFQRAGSGTDTGRRINAEELNNLLTRVVLAATALGAIASFLGGHRLLALVLAPAYRAHSPLISLLILASGCFAAGQIKSLNFMTSLSTHRLIAPKIVTAVAGAGLIVLGARYRGSYGVALAQLCFSLLYLGWIFLLDRRHSVLRTLPLEAA
jgi:O-antigen/teichoic acid export membrane protein